MPKGTYSRREMFFWSKVDKDPDGCWIWTGTKSDSGYGKYGGRGAENHYTQAPHRIAYIDLRGPIPDGLTLDHLCHSNDSSCPGGVTCPHRLCVNPDHLEPVTPRVNVLRGNSVTGANSRRTSCNKCGETYDRVTKAGERECSTCRRAYNTEWWRAKRARLKAASNN